MTANHILVTGIPRCGSTFTGKIMSLSPQLSYIQEPFNPNYGLVGADIHFPTIDTQNPQDKYVALLNDFFSFKAKYRKNYSNDNILRKVAKSVFGTRAHKSYRKANRLQGPKSGLLIKDPDAALLSEQMYLEHDCNVLILVRHPGAVFASFNRLGGAIDVSDIIPENFFNNLNMSNNTEVLKKVDKSMPEQVGLLWVYIYENLNAYFKKYDDWLMLLHEDISINPIPSFKKIFTWAEMDFSERIERKITALTNANNPIMARQNKMHDLSRNSASLADYWKKTVSSEDISVLKKITKPTLSLFYDTASWKI